MAQKELNIQWDALKAAFENHSPSSRSVLDRQTGEILANPAQISSDEDREAQYLTIVPVPSRVQYQMMEDFIDSVTQPDLAKLLADTIVGKGAFRRFKDGLSKYPKERRRWFTYRDALLHQHIFEWLDENEIDFIDNHDWNLEPPPPLSEEEADDLEADEGENEASNGQSQDSFSEAEQEELARYLQAWARSHGPEFQYLFGPAAFSQLSEDLANAFVFAKRR